MSAEVETGNVETFAGQGKEVERPSSPSMTNVPGLRVVGPRPERVYAHKLLLELAKHPLALQWPPYLDQAYKNGRGVWDPDRWHLDRKRGETPEPLERLPGRVREVAREAVAGPGGGGDEDLGQLVLSPQRRSFLSGCAAAPGEPGGEVSLRPEVPGKRVGSGRLLAREPEGPSEGRPGFRRGEERRQQGDEMRRGGSGRLEENGSGRFGFRGGRDEDSGWGEEGGRRVNGRNNGRDDRGWGDERRGNDDRRMPGDRDRLDRGGGRDRDRDRNGRRRQNEPEWMNENISRSDVIELRGFENPSKGSKEQANGGIGKSVNLENLLPGLNNNQQEAGNKPHPGLPTGGISVEDLERDQQQKEAINNKEERNQAKLKNSEKGEQVAPGGGRKGEHGDPNSKAGSEGPYGEGFNYDQIIEGINLNSLLGGSTSAHQEAPVAQAVPQGSRFSQFFSARGGGQPDGGLPGEDGSRRGSLQELHKELGQEGPMIAIPSPNQEERYFAPISPAAQTRTMTNNLMDMIGKGGSAQPPVGRGSGRVQELEEGIRRQLGLGINQPQLAPQGPQAHPQQQGHPYRGHAGPAHLPVKEQVHSQPPEQENMSAFKKLVAQMGGGQQPEQGSMEQAVPFGPGVVRPSPISASLPSNAPTEQEILEHMMASGQHQQQHGNMMGGHQGQRGVPPPVKKPAMPKASNLPPPLVEYLASVPLNTELLARPEADQLMQGLNSGNITVDHLLHQLNNPGVNHRQRDLLLSVLKLRSLGPRPGNMPQGHPPPPPGHQQHGLPPNHGQQGGLPPPIAAQMARVSPVPQQPDPMMLLAQAQQGAPGAASRVSPLMFPPSGHLSVSPAPQAARVPSPQEMTMLTQHIMQQALIKRKLEEQKENFRRRQGDEPPPHSQRNAAPASWSRNCHPSKVVTALPLNKVVPQATVANPSPLSFTPTSVMRKTAAERKDSDPRIHVPELKVTVQKDGTMTSPSDPTAPQCPPSPGRAITKTSSEERDRGLNLEASLNNQRPASLDLAARQRPPHFSGPGAAPPSHTNPLIYLQNNNMAGHINPAMLNQATAMAQQQLAAANLIAHGLDPRLARLPHPHPALAPLSPSRSQPQGFVPQMPQQQQQAGNANLARFFSPEVLAQAQSGSAPAMPPLPTQKVLTLEEIERQAAAVRI